MKVHPIRLDSLPRVDRRSANDRDLFPADQSVVGKELTLNIPSLGAVALACINATAPTAPDPGDAIWALSRHGDDRLGYIILNALTALRLAANAMGVPPTRIARKLGASERGIVAAIIARAFRSASSDIAVLLGNRTWRPGGVRRLIINANIDRVSDHIRIDVPNDWIPRPDGELWLAAVSQRRLEIPLRIELARTTLTASDWSRARESDAIVFDEAAVRPPNGNRDARLICGSFAALLRVDATGGATLLSDFQRHGKEPARPGAEATARKETIVMSEKNSVTDSSTMLAEAPIEVVAEIGRLTMRVDEITALHPGSVLTLGALTPTRVQLMVGERRWAQGELVDVDGQLGVRLTSIY